MPGPYDVPDIEALIGGQGPDPIAALAQALRARQVGSLLQATGNKGLMASGQGLEQGANQDLERGIQNQHWAGNQAVANRRNDILEKMYDERYNAPHFVADPAGRVAFNQKDPTQQVPLPPAAPKPPKSLLPGATHLDVGTKEAQYDDKALQALKKDMDAAAASSRSSFGESARVVFRGARNLAILNQKNPDGSQKQLTEPEWQEVAGGLIAMQTGGAPTQEMMKHGLPRDIEGNAAQIMSWLTSNPHAPDRQQWIQRFIANIDREEQTAKKYQREVQLQRIPAHQYILKKNPQGARKVLDAYGLTPDLDENFNPRQAPADMGQASGPAAATVTPEDQAAKAWLLKNPTHPDAAAVAAKLKAKGL